MDAFLHDTTLTAIVRDEEKNALGGIRGWIKAIVPHVEEAVIVDTGSVDRTKRIAMKMQTFYPHLRVYERPFTGFASARNFSLQQVRTTFALVLDADELLTPEDFEQVAAYMKSSHDAFRFDFLTLYPDGQSEIVRRNVLNPRLFKAQRAYFQSTIVVGWSESIELHHSALIRNLPISIKHFSPTPEVAEMKLMWYRSGQYLTEQPLAAAKREGWKQPNPWRLKYLATNTEGAEMAKK